MKYFIGGYSDFCQEISCFKLVKDKVQFSCNLREFITMAAVIIQVNSGPMVATATDITMAIINYLLTYSMVHCPS